MPANESSLPTHPSFDVQREEEFQQIREALRGLRFGSVNVIVQDGVIVQIDRTDKRRLRRNNSHSPTGPSTSSEAC